MTLTRAIPINVHAAIEIVAAPVLMLTPLLVGVAPVVGVLAFVIGAVLLGLAASALGDRTAVPLSTHAAFDNVLAAGTVIAGAIALATGNGLIALFLVGFGAAQLALTASTRFSVPAGA